MLTDTAIRKVKAVGKRVRLFDAGGLYLEVVPAGGRWWRLKYRFAGKEKLLSLGVYPEVRLADARDRCNEARKLLAEGVDPSVQRRAQRAARAEHSANTFEVVAREWFEKNSPTWAPSHATRVLRRLERDVFPYIGGRPIGELAPPEVLRVLQRIENRNVLETAHRVRTDIGAVFRYAIATGRADRDAAADLRGALKPTNPEHFAAVTDPDALGELLRALWGYHDGTPVVAAALKLAPMLFVRPGELRSAKWADIDLDNGEWKFTASKTKTPHLVPLAPQAVAIFRELQPLTGRGPYVFPSARSNQRPMSDNAVTAPFFHAMGAQGVNLPPSVFEAWFVSAAHDDRAVDGVRRGGAGLRSSGRLSDCPCGAGTRAGTRAWCTSDKRPDESGRGRLRVRATSAS